MGGVNVETVLLLLIAVAGVSVVQLGVSWSTILSGTRQAYHATDATVGWACDDYNNCTLDSLYADETCDHTPYSAGQACQSVCFLPKSEGTMCNPRTGACDSSNASECLGYCASFDNASPDECAAKIPLDTTYWDYTNENLVYSPFQYLYTYWWQCELNQCFAYAVGVLAELDVDNDPYPLPSKLRIDCNDYLNQTEMAVRFGNTACITTALYALEGSNGGSLTGDVIVDTSIFIDTEVLDVDLFVCVYKYACSIMNYTQITKVVNGDQTSLTAASVAAQLQLSPAAAVKKRLRQVVN